jgi:competence protein ComEA
MNENSEVSPFVTLIAFGVIAIAIIVGGVLLWLNQPVPVQITINPPIPTATPEPTASPTPSPSPEPTATREPILVYVTGAVNSPETSISLPYGSRVQDAIDAAGGLAENADLERVNLVGILRDGDQVHVPRIGEGEEEVIPTASGGGIVFINSATIEELMTLPNIGEATAQAILDYREANGNFASIEELDNVEGIGPATLEELAPLISFE